VIPTLREGIALIVAQTTPNTQDELKQAWRDSVAIMAQRARDSLGSDYTTRIDKAQAIVLAGGVHPLGKGDYDVQSETDKELAYEVKQDVCPCKDASNRALQGRCKHVLAIWLYRRALKHPQSTIDSKPQVAAPDSALPEAPVSVSLKGTVAGRPQTLVTIRGNTIAEVKARLAEAAALFDVEPAPVASNGTAHKGRNARKISELTDIECTSPGCGEFYWRNWDKAGKKSWLSHRAADGSWHRGSKARAYGAAVLEA
jgi:hypothetical protein